MLTNKRKWIALILFALLLATPIVGLAQEDSEGAEDTHSEEVAEGEHAEEAADDHGEEEEGSISPLVPLGINQGFLIAQIVNFLLIFGILTVFMWRPLTNMLDSRATTIAKGLEDAAAAANARRNAESDVEKILADARAEAASVIEEARGRGEEVAKSVEEEARSEADRIRQEARTAAEGERNTQLANMRGQVMSISVAVAERLIGDSMSEAKQKELVDNFFSELPEGADALSGALTVVSAMPLSDDEQSDITGKLGSDDVTFTVDPAILGGLIVRSEDRVIDGSVRRGLTEISGRLN